ncbi:MAG: aminotransferase class V-fold PLP-dependent enzyme [Conexibacter sp.]|nr:aminotransferase class V-fold PLP-dependent enzyme [Conexibacter sp.]
MRMWSGSGRRPFGHSVWAAPYRSSARLVVGSSVVAPITLRQLCELGGTDPCAVLDPDRAFDYGPAGGTPELRERIASDLGGLIPDNVAVTSGAGDALASVATLVCRPDAHVIVEVPAHESLLSTVERSGCAATLVQAPIDPALVAELIGPTTSALFLSSPHNPTGQMLDAAVLRMLAESLACVGAVLVADEVFRGVPLGVVSSPPPAATVAPNAVSIGGLSKVYGLPGLRIGWAAGPTMLIDDVRSLQRYTSRCPPMTSEAIAMLALDCQEALLGRARALVYDAFVELTTICERHDGIRLSIPDGGITAFPELDVPDVDNWCARVVERYGILVAPGNACFGVPGRVRINLGLEPEVRTAAFPLLALALAESPELVGGSAC